MRLTLRARQVLALAVVVLLVVVASTVAHLANVARLALGSAADEGALMARQLYHQSARVVAASPTPSPALLQQDPGIRALLEGMIGYSRTVVYAAVVDPSDQILAHSNPKLEGEILPRLQEALGASGPRRLRFAPGPLPEAQREASEARPEPLPEATIDQAREAHSWAAAIDSEELRKTVEKAARAGLARASSGRSVW